MRFFAVACCLVVLVGTAVAFSPIVLTNVLVDRPALKIVAAENFPKDLGCEVEVGSERSPKSVSFRTDGKDGTIKLASMYIGVDSIVMAERKDTKDESHILRAMLTDAAGKVFHIYDFNCDGEWDARIGPREGLNVPRFIHFGTEWLRVDRVDALLSARPTATAGNVNYEFDGKWVKK